MKDYNKKEKTIMKNNFENKLAMAKDIGNYFGVFMMWENPANPEKKRFYIDNEDEVFVYTSLDELLINWLGTLKESDEDWDEYVFFIEQELLGEKIIDDFFSHYLDAYNLIYTYEEMKILDILSRQCERMPSSISLTYEDITLMSHDIYRLWSENKNCKFFDLYPWMKIANSEEEGYSQAFAARIAEQAIELYLKEKNKK
jgi:hypothetical protein